LRWLLSLILLAAWLNWAGCSRELPEPESRGARLYAKFCSGEGCHDAIPPARGGARYWDVQYRRMLELMRQQRFPLPDAVEEREILAYLHRHARKAKKEK
jgi:hypothetical protein